MKAFFDPSWLLLLGVFLMATPKLNAQACEADFDQHTNGLSVGFVDESEHTTGDPIIAWFWEFGDGNTSNLQHPSHTYAAAGSLEVCLRITTTNGCSSTTCDEVDFCELDLQINVGNCTVDNQVALTITITDVYDEAKFVDIFVDGQRLPEGPFEIEFLLPVQAIVLVPGDGLEHSIGVQSTKFLSCQSTAHVQVPNCDPGCFLAGLQVELKAGGIHEVQIQDNFFSPVNTTIELGDQVLFNWLGTNDHSTTSDAVSGIDSWNSGERGFGASFAVDVRNPGLHPYYCIPHGDPGGVGMSGQIIANCPADNRFSLDIGFNVVNPPSTGYDLFIDGIRQNGSPFIYGGSGAQNLTAELPGDGLVHLISIIDVGDPTCMISQEFLSPDCGAVPLCQLSISAWEVEGCNAQGKVMISLEVNGINPVASTFQVLLDGVPSTSGPYFYGQGGVTTLSFSLPGDGLEHRIEVVDSQDDQCRASTVLQTTNCSIPCQLSGLVLSAGEAVIHQVEVQDFAFSPSQVEIKTGDQVEWHWTGSVAHTSTSDATTGPDSWDSGLLGQGNRFRSAALSAGVHRYYCIPHGGPGGLGMAGLISVQPDCTEGVVSVTASFTAQAGSAAGFGVKVDGIETASHSYTEPTGINTIAIAVVGDGQTHQIEIFDIDQPACTVFDSIKVENCEVPTCFIEITDIQEGSCTANGLRIYTISLTSSEERSEGFKVSIDGQVQEDTIYSYATTGLTNLTLELPGDEQMHQISVQDISSLSCTDTITLSSSSCGETCSIYLNAVQLSGCTSDSLIPYELQVHVNPSQQRLFRLQIDGQVVYDTTLAPMGQDTVALPVVLPGDGKTHVIHLSQVGSENCEDSVVVSTLNCGISCSITGLSFEIGSRKEQEIQVLDFEFHPKEVSIEQGDLVRFNWIGSIPHTSTSDATGGPDGWNSGLLGQGSSFEVSISELGDHPYYCIPHGSPGGIGMAGLIQVEDPCADLALAVRTQFTAVNGNLSGYVVSIDDQVLGTTPFLYSESGQETVSWNMEAQGNSFQIGIYDVEDPGCRIDTILTMPNCTDPCFGFSASFFEYAIDVSNYTVDFTIEEKEADRWYWTFGNGVESTAQNPSIIYEQPGIYEVCLTSEQATTGCSAIWCQVLEIRAVVCEAAFELEQEGLSLKLQNQSVSTSPLETMVWTFGEASIATVEDQLEYTFDTLGQYPVCLAISTAECQSDTCITVNLSDPCLILEPNFSYIHSSEGLGIQFEDVSQGNVNQWLWGFGNGFTANEQHPIHAYERAGTYKVCLLVQDTLAQCSAAYCEEILVGTTSRQTVPSLNRKLTIYPNPISVSRLQWTVSGLQQEDLNQRLVVKLYDLRGKTLYQGQVQGQEEILFSIEGLVALSTGIYFLELKNGPVIYHGKIIIQ